MIVKVQAMYRAETAILNAEQEELHNETSFVVGEDVRLTVKINDITIDSLILVKLLIMILLLHVKIIFFVTPKVSTPLLLFTGPQEVEHIILSETLCENEDHRQNNTTSCHCPHFLPRRGNSNGKSNFQTLDLS